MESNQRATEDANASSCDYDAFLSFQASDTWRTFTDVLCHHMYLAGLKVFISEDEVAPGDMINKILPEIHNSKVCIPIFSQTFASSKRCLWEVTKMVELKKQILPIFYDVSTEDVKLRTPVYDKFMDVHVTKGESEVDEWKKALKQITKIKGREVLNTSYTPFCKTFVEEVLIKLKPRKTFDIDPMIGFEDQLHYAMTLLDIQSPGVRYIGIFGMGGIGKTALAKDIFNRISYQFDSCSFLEDVRESFELHGIENLLEELLKSHNPKSGRLSGLFSMMEKCFCGKKVLVVLDDVNKWEQIEKLAGRSSWFGSGSRIIVTTRNKSVMETGYMKLREKEVWNLELEPLGDDEAIQLFSRHAFQEGTIAADFEDVSKDVVSLAAGLPLALKNIGLLLYEKTTEECEEIIEGLKEVPEPRLKNRLIISYDALDNEQKQIFLDIACFFIGNERTNPFYMWEACKFYPQSGLEVLRSMSLVKVSDDGKLWMHDQHKYLGRDIVREENIKDSTKRSRLWEDERARSVLMSKKDKEIVEALRVEEYCAIDSNRGGIGSLENLRYLELRQATLSGDFEELLPNLRWLSYQSDQNFEATNFPMANLVILDFSHSSINENWCGWSQLKNAKNLKVLDLTGAKHLTRTPYFPEGMSLERLILRGCSELVAIDSSIGNLKRLVYLDLEGCVSLTSLPEEIGHLRHLEGRIVMTGGQWQSTSH